MVTRNHLGFAAVIHQISSVSWSAVDKGGFMGYTPSWDLHRPFDMAGFFLLGGAGKTAKHEEDFDWLMIFDYL